MYSETHYLYPRCKDVGKMERILFILQPQTPVLKLLEGCTTSQIVTTFVLCMPRFDPRVSRYGICGKQSVTAFFPCHLFHQGPIFIFKYQVVDSLAQKATNKDVA